MYLQIVAGGRAHWKIENEIAAQRAKVGSSVNQNLPYSVKNNAPLLKPLMKINFISADTFIIC